MRTPDVLYQQHEKHCRSLGFPNLVPEDGHCHECGSSIFGGPMPRDPMMNISKCQYCNEEFC